MKTPSEEKPLFKVKFQSNEKSLVKTELLELLTYDDIELRIFIKELFKKQAELFSSRSQKHLIVLEEEDPNKIIIYQSVLEKIEIDSVIIEPNLSNLKYKLLIIQPRSLVHFRDFIGEDLFEVKETVHEYFFKLDWED